MDVDKAIEFLLSEGARLDALCAELAKQQQKTDAQLRAAVRLGAAMSRRAFNAIDALAGKQRETDKKLDALAEHGREADGRIAALAEHGGETDGRIDALTEHGRETDGRIAALAEQQRETGAQLQAFIQNTERRWGGNGQGPRTGA